MAECKKVFVNSDKKAYIICPQCGCNRCITADKFAGSHKVKFECECSHVFEVSFDYRQYYRKAIHLEGFYSVNSFQHVWRRMVVRNLSMSGLGFTREDGSKIAEGDRLLVRFSLDDHLKSKIEKEVIVHDTTDNYLGCKFIGLDLFEKALGFYLMP